MRSRDVAPLVNDLIDWMKCERAKLSRHDGVAKAMDYMLRRVDEFTRFLQDGRICSSNNAAERALRGVALGRKNHLFAGSDGGGHRWAVLCSLVESCKLNDVEPYTYLRDVLTRMVDGHPINRLDELLPWARKARHAVKS